MKPIDKEKVKEVDERIEKQKKKYDTKMRSAMLKAKDFSMTN